MLAKRKREFTELLQGSELSHHATFILRSLLRPAFQLTPAHPPPPSSPTSSNADRKVKLNPPPQYGGDRIWKYRRLEDHNRDNEYQCLPRGVSRLGGDPDVPSDFRWPLIGFFSNAAASISSGEGKKEAKEVLVDEKGQESEVVIKVKREEEEEEEKKDEKKKQEVSQEDTTMPYRFLGQINFEDVERSLVEATRHRYQLEKADDTTTESQNENKETPRQGRIVPGEDATVEDRLLFYWFYRLLPPCAQRHHDEGKSKHKEKEASLDVLATEDGGTTHCPKQYEKVQRGLLSLFFAETENDDVFWRDEGYIKAYYFPCQATSTTTTTTTEEEIVNQHLHRRAAPFPRGPAYSRTHTNGYVPFNAITAGFAIPQNEFGVEKALELGNLQNPLVNDTLTERTNPITEEEMDSYVYQEEFYEPLASAVEPDIKAANEKETEKKMQFEVSATLFGFPCHNTLGYDPTPSSSSVDEERKENREKESDSKDDYYIPLLNLPSYYEELHQCWADGDRITIFILLSDLKRGTSVDWWRSVGETKKERGKLHLFILFFMHVYIYSANVLSSLFSFFSLIFSFFLLGENIDIIRFFHYFYSIIKGKKRFNIAPNIIFLNRYIYLRLKKNFHSLFSLFFLISNSYA